MYDNVTLSHIIPNTIDLGNIKNDKKFLKNNKIYILKKDMLQQQKGLYLSNDEKEILELSKNKEYVVIQEFLENPFIIHDTLPSGEIINRKINLRIYVLVIVDHGRLKVFLYKNGFVYYTPLSFEYSLNKNKTITTGYIDRSVYERNPLTLKDLKCYVESKNYNYDIFWSLLELKFASVFKAYKESWKKNNSQNVHYQIFGADVEPNSDFDDLKIIEFNKGPDLDAKDHRDKELKDNMFKDSLKIVFANDNTDANLFTEIVI